MPGKPFRPPSKQGRHDGMCGLYAVLNSIKYIYPNARNSTLEAVFRASALAIKDEWPAPLWEGTSVVDVRSMIEKSREVMSAKHPKYTLVVTEPFRQRSPASVVDYFTHVRVLLSKGNTAMILGLGTPWDHWTVVRGVTDKSVWFLDSYGIDMMHLSALTFKDEEAGNKPGDLIKVDRHQAFLISRQPKVP